MEKYFAAKGETDRRLEDLEAKLDESLCKIREKGESLMKKKDELTKRESELTKHIDGLDIHGSDIIKLNVGGTKMTVRRDTLCLIKGSRLEALFSGTWEEKLLRDEDDCVFMDLDPHYFKRIIDYLYLQKLSNNSVEFQDMPKVSPKKEQERFDFYVDFFHLRATIHGTNGTCSNGNQNDDIITPESFNPAGNCYDAVVSCFEIEEKELAFEELKLKKMEEDIEKQEHFFAIFAKGSSGDAILNLSVDGEVIQTKQSTLCLCEGSLFAKNFQDNEWLAENTFIDDNGNSVILIEQPIAIFKPIINQLRLRAMMNLEDVFLPIRMENHENFSLLERYVSVLFPGNYDFIIGFDPHSIIPSPNYSQMKLWLAEVRRNTVPELLYCASRDGWKANDFHRKCDNKGATLTIVTSKEGYVFGGYSDHSWSSGSYKSSNEAFMFTMKCHAGLPPTKMKLKDGCTHNALYTNFSHGPCFGSGIDLVVGYNGDLRSGYSNLGRTYELPEGVWNTFLTGKHGSNRKFQVSEVEVFKV